MSDADSADRRPGGAPLPPGEVLRLVLPAFLVSTGLAIIGVVLILVGQQAVGLALVVIAAVGGLFYRARRVMRAQERRLPPER